MLKSIAFLLCLILGQLSFAQTQRIALIEEAFKGLPFYVYASLNKLDEDAYLNESVKSFTAEENRMLRELLDIVLMNHGKSYKLQFCGNRPCFDRNGKVSFDLEKGQVERTAITSPHMDESIFINIKKLNDPNAQMDFIDAIQLLIHEVSWKIPNRNASAAESLAAKITNTLRNFYSTFQVNNYRKVHILSLDRPNRYEATDLPKMKVFWLDQQGFEITTFDETAGYFRHIEEVRHQFANPGLVNPQDSPLNEKFKALTRSSVVGVEVDRFSDSTTVIRIAADHSQTLLENNLTPTDLGPNTELSEVVIRLKDKQAPQISKRQGYLPKSQNPGHLYSFEVKDSVLIGDGILPFYLSDMKDMALHLLVRTNRGLLSLPLKITSKDPKGPVIFHFERKLSPEVLGTQLIATDIIVNNNGFMVPINKIPLQVVKSVELKPSMKERTDFKLKNALVHTENGWRPMHSNESKIGLGDNKIRFIFQSQTPLQELTLYLGHSRQVYDPKELTRKNEMRIRQESLTVGPSMFDNPISSESETDVFRIDASQMKQVLRKGQLEVEVTIPVREAVSLEQPHPYTYAVGIAGYTHKVQSKINYGIDEDGIKILKKVVAVNQNLQDISISKSIYSAQLKDKKGHGVTEESWKEFHSAFAPLDNEVQTPECKKLLE